tara:strand:- start:4196 stop:4531 length:336 start_codon:yes stop_codon:yes gene_type:complete
MARLILKLAKKNAKYLKQMMGRFAPRSKDSQKISHIARNYLNIKPKGEIYMSPSKYKSAENIAIKKAKEVVKRTKNKNPLPTEADEIYLEGERMKELWWERRIRQDAGLLD